MSTTKQRADMEAATVEHELTDDEAAQLHEAVEAGAKVPDALQAILAARETGDDPEPDESAGGDTLTGEPTPKQLRELDGEVSRHLEAVRTIMGHHVAEMVPCEACGGVGLQSSGAPRPHENFRPCATCNGYGEVLTGSKREGYTSRQCPTCKGRGYLERLDAQGAPVSPDGPPIPNEPTAPVPVYVPNTEPAAVTTQNGGGFGVPSWMGDPQVGG